MERRFVIFVPEEKVNESEYSYVIEWAYNHIQHPNVLSLSEEDVYFIQYKTEILDIVNKENDGMLQMGENDWIIFDDIKKQVQLKLENYNTLVTDNRINYLIRGIIQLLQKSINTKKNIYFNF